jgi:hypothetical protein
MMEAKANLKGHSEPKKKKKKNVKPSDSVITRKISDVRYK